jgi:hypothetical protein
VRLGRYRIWIPPAEMKQPGEFIATFISLTWTSPQDGFDVG